MNIYNHFKFNFFGFQWWLMNIYFRFNFIWRLMMARRKIGWERSFRFRLMKIVTYFNFNFFSFFQWLLMNIYNRFNSIRQLMMARREIGWERSYRFQWRLLKILTYFNFNLFSQCNGGWWIFTIFQFQLMMARREIGRERISSSANLSERPNDHRSHRLKINPFTLLLNCSRIY